MNLEQIIYRSGVAILLGLCGIVTAMRAARSRGWPGVLVCAALAGFAMTSALLCAFSLGWDGGRIVMGRQIAEGAMTQIPVETTAQ